MKKYILGLFVLSFVLIPWFSFAQVSDIYYPNPSMSDCVSIVNNLRYRDRDVNKNGEVSTLQDFLQGVGYLNNEPTGYFGLLTFKAVKDFQRANNINSDGSVGPITRAKIKNLTCNGTIPPTEICCEIFGYGAYMIKTSSTYEMMSRSQCTTGAGFVGGGRNIVDNNYCKSISSNPVISGVSGPQSLNVNQTGTWIVNASDTNGGNLSYSVNWGDVMIYGSGTSMIASQFPVQQSAIFTHSYSYAGTFSPIFTVTNVNGKSANTSLSVNVGGIVPNSSITVLSPNGGETLYRGNNFQINWVNNNYTNGCPVGANCNCNTTAFYGYYDINLVPSYPVCAGGMYCSMVAMPYHAPYPVAQQVYGSAYNWQVGNIINNGVFGAVAPSGSYTIQICKSGTDVCDSSDNYFSIISLNTSAPSITVLSPNGGEIYQLGQDIPITWNTKNIPANASIIPVFNYVDSNDYDEIHNSGAQSLENVLNTGSAVITPPVSLIKVLGKHYKITLVYQPYATGPNAIDARDSSDNLFAIQ